MDEPGYIRQVLEGEKNLFGGVPAACRGSLFPVSLEGDAQGVTECRPQKKRVSHPCTGGGSL